MYRTNLFRCPFISIDELLERITGIAVRNTVRIAGNMEDFSFPFEPYDIQLSLMRTITSCINEGKIGVLESPTGTGKSMSIICATLSWLEKFERERRTNLEEQLKAVQEVGKDEDDWLKAHVKKFKAVDNAKELFTQLENNQKIDERIEKALKNVTVERKRRLLSKEDIIEEKDEEIDDMLDEEFSNDQLVRKIVEEPTPSCTKIIYASRTHSQLLQFADEITKTRFQPRIVTLGSRQQLCINESVRNLKKANLMTERCNELRDNKVSEKRQKNDESKYAAKVCKGSCPFARSDAIEDLCDQILASKLSNAPHLVEYGKKLSGCPYFASRKAVNYSQLVLVPYQILLQEDSRKAWGVELKDNVVVIDEAHNLLETITSSHFITLYGKGLKSVLSILDMYLSRFQSRLTPLHKKYLRQLSAIVNVLLVYLYHSSNKNKNYMETMTTFASKACLAHYKLDILLEYIGQTHLIMKLTKFSRRVNKEDNRATKEVESTHQFSVERLLRPKDSPNKFQNISIPGSSASQNTSSLLIVEETVGSALCAFQQFLKMLTLNYKNGRLVIESASGNDEPKISYYLINPTSQLGDIIKQCRSLILIGGTLEPSKTLIHSLALCCEVDPDKDLIRRSFGHVINERQLLALTITSVRNIKLLLTHGKRETQLILNLLVMTLARIAAVVPNGMVVFFPSYGYLEEFVQKTPMNALRKIKPLFIERKSSSPTLFNEFTKSARNKKGALLLAVIGGKLSEGINFSDELGRAVVVVGLPYMNSEDLIVQEKLKFMQKEFGPRSGTEYYEAKCMHAINQSIGRAIRHRNDYAAIVLIDLRYKNERIVRDLPSWIQPRLHNAVDLSDGIEYLQNFFRSFGSSSISSS
uniref:Helicase ATP-binding domain-containing protein n=1 Tax=Setaria digitata TaxID=48799 RepID=A0A915PGH1_9BILA